MIECEHGNFAPDELIDALPAGACESRTGRWRCAICAYNEGKAASLGKEFPGPAEECAQQHAFAPVSMLKSIEITQRQPYRHRCAYKAYQLGKLTGGLPYSEQDEANSAEALKAEEVEATKLIQDTSVGETQKVQLLLARRGQGLFRKRVIAENKVCALSGIGNIKFLIASHIKPWRSSDNVERLDGANGLLLVPHLDLLFDKGWLSLESNGDVLLSPQLDPEIVSAWGLTSLSAKGRLKPSQAAYLEYHRAVIFRS